MWGELRITAALAFAASLAVGCVDQANTPLLLAVGTPVRSAGSAHSWCVGEANVTYERQVEEFARRARMTGYGVMAGDLVWQEMQAKGAARQKYLSCVSGEGYRAVYG
jgi:hypothetical protein